MKIRSIRYYINEAFISLIRNRLMALASIVTVASCILTVSLFFCIAVNLDGMLQQIENSVGLTVYINDEISTDEVKKLHEKINSFSYIKTIDYVSSELALEEFKATLGDDGEILAGLEKTNPLPRSFNIELNDAAYHKEAIELLEGLESEGVAKVRHSQTIIDTLDAINSAVRLISAIIITILLITSIVIIMNTIRLTVINRKLEINIMKYVGATDAFIRWPFIIEGILIGFIGSSIPIAICWIGYPNTVDIIYDKLPILQGIVTFKHTMEIFTVLLPLALAIGIVVGVIGSITSIRKHLRV